MNKPPDPKDFDDMFNDPDKAEAKKDARKDVKAGHSEEGSANSKWGKISTTPAEGWSTVSLDAGNEEMPPPGIYKATLEVDIRDKGTVLWLNVNYRLDGHKARPRGDMGALAALPTSEHYHRVGDGKRLLRRLAMATGHGMEREFQIDDLVKTFTNQAVRLRLIQREREGIPELVVAEILPA